VSKDNVTQYQTTQTRYEGSADDVKLVERTGPIAHP
jgi:simple sugar transport system substrate-binding protein